jgi:hypothetical protein
MRHSTKRHQSRCLYAESEPKGRGPSQYSKGGFGVGPTRSIDRHATTAPCAFETFERRLESTSSGHRRPRPWTPELGGQRPYRGRLGNDRSPRHSRHSVSRQTRSRRGPEGRALYDQIWQASAVLLPVPRVGAMGEGRTYDQRLRSRLLCGSRRLRRDRLMGRAVTRDPMAPKAQEQKILLTRRLV